MVTDFFSLCSRVLLVTYFPMKSLSKADYYQVRWMNGSTLVDEDALHDLYLPLLKNNGYALYQTLRGDRGTLPAKGLLLRLDLTTGEFGKAIAPLEAVGLVRTFVQPFEGGVQLFVFCLYPPKTAKSFFDDYLLQGTLHGFVGDDVFNYLASKYKRTSEIPDAEEISSSFPKVFDQNFPQNYYLQGSALAGEGGNAKERLSFDRGLFLKKLGSLGLRGDLLSGEEIESIEKLATLYSIKEELMADYVYESLTFKARVGKKVDLTSLANKCRSAMPFAYLRKEEGESSQISGETVMAKKIQIMDSVAPSEYLSIRQGGHKPALADLKLVEKLSMQMGLSDPCINALVDYVLMTHDNTLSSALCEKIAASMVREGCRSAKDAMDYLLRSHKRGKARSEKPSLSQPATSKPVSAQIQDEDEEEVSDEEVKEMLAKLYNGAKK